MILTMSKYHENLLSNSPMSLLFIVKFFSSLETKMVLKTPNETFLRITRYHEKNVLKNKREEKKINLNNWIMYNSSNFLRIYCWKKVSNHSIVNAVLRFNARKMLIDGNGDGDRWQWQRPWRWQERWYHGKSLMLVNKNEVF